MERTAYPGDVSDEEWAFVAAYLRLMREDAPQGEHDLREVFNGLRLDNSDRVAMANAAARLASMVYGLSAKLALDTCRGV